MSVNYVDFRMKVYEIIDEYMEMLNDPYVDSPRINLEDSIDNLLMWVENHYE